jgi:hypothetical protein
MNGKSGMGLRENPYNPAEHAAFVFSLPIIFSLKNPEKRGVAYER